MSHSTPEFRPVPGIWPTIRDRWPLVASCLLVGLLLGYLAAAVLPQAYEATTTVSIGPGLVAVGDVTNDNSLTGAEQAAIATLDPQLSQIATTLGGGVTRDDVEGQLSVVNRPDTSLLDFSYTADSAAAAASGSDASAQVYLDRAKGIAETRLNVQADEVRQNLTATTSLGQQFTLEQQLRELQTTVVTPGVVLKDARGTAKASGIPHALFAPLGALTGLLIGIVTVYLLEGRRPRVLPGSPLPLGAVELLGRIRVRDTPQTASRIFVIPGLMKLDPETATIGLAVLGDDADSLTEFSIEALELSGSLPADAAFPLDLGTADGLKAARDVNGVILIVRERTTTVEEVDTVLRRLQSLGVPTYGVVTAPAHGPVHAVDQDALLAEVTATDAVTSTGRDDTDARGRVPAGVGQRGTAAPVQGRRDT